MLYFSGANLKEIWETLIRGHSNALRRQSNKKSGNGATKRKPWQLMDNKLFLLPVKALQKSKGNFDDNEDDEESESEIDTSNGASRLEEGSPTADTEEPQVPQVPIMNEMLKPTSVKYKQKQKRKADDESEDKILNVLKEKKTSQPLPGIAFFE